MTKEGVRTYRIRDAALVRDRTALLGRTFTVMHVIDEASPLFGRTPASCEADEVEIVLSVVGIDAISLQPVHGRQRYLASDIRWGFRLADVHRIFRMGASSSMSAASTIELEPTDAFPYPSGRARRPEANGARAVDVNPALGE